MTDDVDDLFKRALTLRARSDELNRRRHAPDVTDAEYDALGIEKRRVDDEAFALEQRVREMEEAAYPPDAVSTVVEAEPIAGGI